MSIYSWKPAVFLPATPISPQLGVPEKAQSNIELPGNQLDMHVEDVLKFVFLLILETRAYSNSDGEISFGGL